MRQAQRSLFEARNRHEEAWREFHAANPHVADALTRRALRAKRRGYRPGIKPGPRAESA